MDDYEMKQKKQIIAVKLILTLGPEAMPTDLLTIVSRLRTQDGLAKKIEKTRVHVCRGLMGFEQK